MVDFGYSFGAAVTVSAGWEHVGGEQSGVGVVIDSLGVAYVCGSVCGLCMDGCGGLSSCVLGGASKSGQDRLP